MEILSHCPVCGSKNTKLHLECEDYFLSNELYNLDICQDCQIIFTNPRPVRERIGGYYKSKEYISHTNNSKGFINGLYQFVRNYTLMKKFRLVKKYSNGNSILDIGCATGEFLNFFKLNNWDTVGIEPDDEARKLAIDNYNVDVWPETELSKIDDKSKDVITMWHVLEHVYDLDERIKELHRILKENGTCFIAVPNHLSFDAEYYGKFWAAYDVPRHVYHFNKSSIKFLFQKHSFELVDIFPMKFDSYYVSMLSEKYKNKKSNLLKAFWIGFKSNFKAMKNNEFSSLIYVLRKNTQF